MKSFSSSDLKNLYKAPKNSSGEDNGQIIIIGGSELFHGAPILALKTSSRLVDMVFFATPAQEVREVVLNIKSSINSFIFVPWNERNEYIQKSDCVLIGNGFMRYKSEKTPKHKRKGNDRAGRMSRNIVLKILKNFPDKKFVIDAGALQVIKKEEIPANCIITPNKNEYRYLFGSNEEKNIQKISEQLNCTIVLKDVETKVCSKGECVVVKGGNAGLTKGGTGDIQAGLTAALYAKNDALLAASAASFIVKKTAENLEKSVGLNFNADDVSENVFKTLNKLIS